jgi:hypothetical protein
MNKQLFGLFLILYGCFKIIVPTLNEISPESILKRLQTIPVIGGVFGDKDDTIARHVFNVCFFLYGIDSLMHGLYLNRIGITHQPWILTHEGSYIFHFALGAFMFSLFYGLVDANESFYVVEGIYSGLILMAIVPIMYMYNTWDKLTTGLLPIFSIVSLCMILFVGHSVMLEYPDRVPNVIDIIAISLNSL